MRCPKCFHEDIEPQYGHRLTEEGETETFISHYECLNNEGCQTGPSNTEFLIVQDDKVHFPYNQIYRGRPVSQFLRKPYLVLKEAGVVEKR